MAVFKWTPKRARVAILLAEGYTITEVSTQTAVPERTIYNWKTANEFGEEVDRLSLMVDIASRAARLRIAKRMVRKLGETTAKDLLDWLKFAQSETDGIKLNFAALYDDAASMAARRSTGVGTAPATEDQQQSN